LSPPWSLDVVITALVIYAAVLVAAGAWVSRRVKHAGDFFVAGRQLSAGMIFTTFLAANIGAGSTVGATGMAYRYGLSAWWWSGSAAIGCLLLGLFVAPRMHRLAADGRFLTVGDFLEARFDRSVRGLIGVILWFGTLLILAGQLIAMAWALSVVAGIPKSWGCVLSGIVLIAYVGGGGLLASAWVNLLELIVLLVGFALALPYAWHAAGGWSGLAGAAGPSQVSSFGGLWGLGLPAILGLLVTFVPSFIVSPGLVQKAYGARSPAAARWGIVANAVALAVFACLPAILGMATRALRPGLVNPELALPTLLAELLPPEVGALGLAALFAAEISTADAVLFMLTTSLSQDLYKTFLRPDADDARLLRVSRFTAVAAGGMGVLLALVLESVAGALKAFYGVLTVALFVPLVVGLFWRRPTAWHARVAVLGAVVVSGITQVLAAGSAHAAWLPYAAGIGAAALVFATAGLKAR
jgi:solute:Na+ symporter, SSS family